MKQNKKSDLELRPGDIHAILSALPLVANAETGDIILDRVNLLACQTAAEKLTRRKQDFTANETKVVYLAIGGALDVIEGKQDSFVSSCEVDAEWLAELKQNFFIYNRLFPLFAALLPPDCM